MTTSTDDILSKAAEDQIFEHLERYSDEVDVFRQQNSQDIQQNKTWMASFQERARRDSTKVILRRPRKAPGPR